MTLEGCHLCRKPETKEALAGDFIITGLEPDFFGTFDIDVHPVSKETDQTNAHSTFGTSLLFKVQADRVSSSLDFA